MDDIWGWTMSGKPLNFTAVTFLSADRDYCVVAKTPLYTANGIGVEVSTVFLVQTASPDPVMPADLFETMIFTGDEAVPDPGPFGINFGYKARYPTWDAALAGHVRHVEALRREGLRLALAG